jgi:hypothetical protein
MARHEKVAILPPENVHEVFGRSVSAPEHVMKRDLSGWMIHLPVALVERYDLHGVSSAASAPAFTDTKLLGLSSFSFLSRAP